MSDVMTNDRPRTGSISTRTHGFEWSRHVATSLPTLLLVFWTALTAFGAENKTLTYLMLASIFVALCNEARIRHNYRKDRLRGPTR